jgi:hypothetical protein
VNNFELPPNISVTRQLLPNGIAYVFRDVELGELRRQFHTSIRIAISKSAQISG